MATQRKLTYQEFTENVDAAFQSLERGDEQEVLVDKAGRQYRLELIPEQETKLDIWKNYDPERVLAAFREAQGIFDGIDVDQLKRDIKASRGQDSIGRPAD